MDAKFTCRYTKQAAISLRPLPPFHFDGTFFKPSHFPSGLMQWSPGQFRQTMRVRDKLVGLTLRDKTRRGDPKVDVTAFHDSSLDDYDSEAIAAELTFRYGFNTDLREFHNEFKNDPKFGHVFRRWRGMRSSTPYSLYELIVVGLVLQNANVRRTVQMLQALLDRLGTQVCFDGVALQAIWPAGALDNVTEEELRALKIGYRARILKRISAEFSSGLVDEFSLRALDTDDVRKALISLYGVGPETVRILLTEAFHRDTGLDHIAPWQQKLYSRLLCQRATPVAPERIASFARRRFGRHAVLAVHYIWEDLFWRHRNEPIDWLISEIRL